MMSWMKIKAALNINVVIPMFILVIKFNAYEIELMGVVPRVEVIENATPKDIINKPIVNEQTLLSIL